METKPLDAAGVCAIIEAAGKAKLAKLSFNELKIEFSMSNDVQSYVPVTLANPTPEEMGRSQLQAAIADAEEDLIYTDPVEYERRLSTKSP